MDTAGNLYAADTNERILKRTSSGSVSTLISGWDSHGLTIAPDGYLYATDRDNDRVVKINTSTGAVVDTYADSAFSTDLRDLCVDADGTIYVADIPCVYKIDGVTEDVTVFTGGGDEGDDSDDGIPAEYSSQSQSMGVTIGPDGNLYITYRDDGSVKKIVMDDEPSGSLPAIGKTTSDSKALGGICRAATVAADSEGYLLLGLIDEVTGTGAHTAAFRLKVSDNSLANGVCRLEVWEEYIVRESIELTADDFNDTENYQQFDISFTKSIEDSQLQYRLYWYDDVVDLCADEVIFSRSDTVKVFEAFQ